MYLSGRSACRLVSAKLPFTTGRRNLEAYVLRGIAVYVSWIRRIVGKYHSSLPASVGTQHYHRAFELGVKIIVATSRYLTQDLDEGHIIEQCVAKVSHNDTVDGLKTKGKDIEKMVLSRAISLHL